jgi:hypothetical protein
MQAFQFNFMFKGRLKKATGTKLKFSDHTLYRIQVHTVREPHIFTFTQKHEDKSQLHYYKSNYYYYDNVAKTIEKRLIRGKF